MSFAHCQLTCGSDNRLFWPLPHTVSISNEVSTFDPTAIEIVFDPPVKNKDIRMMIENLVFKRRDVLVTSSAKNIRIRKPKAKADPLQIKFVLSDLNLGVIKRATNESYSLTLKNKLVEITADNFFGARHAVETLFQVTHRRERERERE